MKTGRAIPSFYHLRCGLVVQRFEDPVLTGHPDLFFGYHRYLQRHREIGGHSDRHFVVAGSFNRLFQLNFPTIHRKSLCLQSLFNLDVGHITEELPLLADSHENDQ